MTTDGSPTSISGQAWSRRRITPSTTGIQRRVGVNLVHWNGVLEDRGDQQLDMIREESDEIVETHPVRHAVLDDVADEDLFRAQPRGNN